MTEKQSKGGHPAWLHCVQLVPAAVLTDPTALRRMWIRVVRRLFREVQKYGCRVRRDRRVLFHVDTGPLVPAGRATLTATAWLTK